MFYSLDIYDIETELQGLLIKDAIESTLLDFIADLDYTFDILVVFEPESEMGETAGMVSQEDDDEYIILLSDHLLKDPLELYKTVAHEAVHIAQYVSKDLLHLPYGKYAWKGSIMSNIEYLDRPWEIQAYKYEEKATCRFVKNPQFATLVGMNSQKWSIRSLANFVLDAASIASVLLIAAALFQPT